MGGPPNGYFVVRHRLAKKYDTGLAYEKNQPIFGISDDEILQWQKPIKPNAKEYKVFNISKRSLSGSVCDSGEVRSQSEVEEILPKMLYCTTTTSTKKSTL
jgi:hypothetical protein